MERTQRMASHSLTCCTAISLFPQTGFVSRLTGSRRLKRTTGRQYTAQVRAAASLEVSPRPHPLPPRPPPRTALFTQRLQAPLLLSRLCRRLTPASVYRAFASIAQCCEREKIIPRESVLRKKLLDGHSSLDVDFEDFLTCVVGSGVGVMEGCSPQRVVWPRDGDTARRFAW